MSYLIETLTEQPITVIQLRGNISESDTATICNTFTEMHQITDHSDYRVLRFTTLEIDYMEALFGFIGYAGYTDFVIACGDTDSRVVEFMNQIKRDLTFAMYPSLDEAIAAARINIQKTIAPALAH